MTPQHFESLVARLEDDARRHPSSYVARVVVLSLTGYVYVGVVLCVLLALLVGIALSVTRLGFLGAKLLLILGPFVWMILRALRVKQALPEGREVDATTAPALFAEIDALRRALKAPHFHRVLVTPQFNAGVVQVPRLGLLGWSRNYLLVGLPLMSALTVQQFKAVLAHEFGHLARGHGRVANWLYRQRLRWARLLAMLDATRSAGGFLFKPFLHWFAPYFNAYSFPLARANEYEADATSVRLTSPVAAAQALTAVNVMGSYLAERYWPSIHRQANEVAQPAAFAPFAAMRQQLATDPDPMACQGWLNEAMAQRSSSADTHPALADRLRAIGQPPALVRPGPGAAADRLLGDALPSIEAELDGQWKRAVQPHWERRHQEAAKARASLDALEQRRAAGETLSLDERLARIELTENFTPDSDRALAELRALRSDAPDHAVVAMLLGTRLLARNDPAGFDDLQRAMTLDSRLTSSVFEARLGYQRRHGPPEAAAEFEARLRDRRDEVTKAHAERARVTAGDEFLPHGMPSDEAAALRKQLAELPNVRKAWLVRKTVKHLAEQPHYVFAFQGPITAPTIAEAVRFPEDTVLCDLDHAARRVRWKIARVEGARLV